mmetsp:Transcript_9828/g.40270  ORF Transcript_9828/g.40270 Transcript_9828/m.40270 type:complete len:396 (-) Transcript_9828:116-1303(-)
MFGRLVSHSLEVLSNSIGFTPRHCAIAWITSTSVANHLGITAEPDSLCSDRNRSSAHMALSVKSTSMLSTRLARSACTSPGSDETVIKQSTSAAISRRPFLSESKSARKRLLVYRSGSENVSGSKALTTIVKIRVIALFCSASFAGPTAALKRPTLGNTMSSFAWQMSIIGSIRSAATGILHSRSRSVRRQVLAGSPSAMSFSCDMSSILGSAAGGAASAVSASSMDMAMALASSSCDGVISSSFSSFSAAASFSSAMIVSSVSSRSTSRSSSFPVSFAAASSPQPNSRPASARRVGSAHARSIARRFSLSSAAARSSRMRTPAVSLAPPTGLAKDPTELDSTGTSESSASKPRRSRSSAHTAYVTSGSSSASAPAPSISDTISSVASPSRPCSL